MKRLILLTYLVLLSAHAAPPNVVFLVSDDHAWNDYGFMGHEHIQTPHLDRLAAESLVFTRGTTHSPLCRPSLSTILTGLHPHQHGVTGNDPVLPVKGINLFHWKGHIEPRMDRENLAGNIDLWPTLASLLNRKTPAYLPGIDLTDAAAVAQRQSVFGESYAHNIANLKQPAQSLQHRYIINGWHKLIVPAGEEPPELYNLKNDPWENHNLAPNKPEIVKALLDKLNAWWTP